MNALELRGLRRDFGARRALDTVELEVAPGTIVGLVGPNGSGKTTLLEIAAGLLRPTAGTARVFGLNPFTQREAVMRSARFAFAPPALFEALTPREHLRALCALQPGPERVCAAECDAALELVGLRERADDRVQTFSFGMRQRVAIAQALVPQPKLLVLDEPTDGLDPLAVLELRAILARLRSEHGTAVLLSSHLLVEVDELADQLLVLVEGRSAFYGPPEGLRAGREHLILKSSDDQVLLRALVERRLSAKCCPELRLPLSALTLNDAQALCGTLGIDLQAFSVQRPTLEHALLEHLAQHRAEASAC